ncbi:hypothetical protein PV325_007013 [Microctonus aethiopoides]|nr:hypothetical protein PV325_007013 [Microctonus aethiopoides]
MKPKIPGLRTVQGTQANVGSDEGFSSSEPYNFHHYQSPRAHVADVNSDRIAMKSNFLIPSGTCLDNHDPINIPYFYLIVTFKRNIRAGGGVKYHNNNDSYELLVKFLNNTIGSKMLNKQTEPITRLGTTIDALSKPLKSRSEISDNGSNVDV